MRNLHENSWPKEFMDIRQLSLSYKCIIHRDVLYKFVNEKSDAEMLKPREAKHFPI